jgi:hypothetical protein
VQLLVTYLLDSRGACACGTVSCGSCDGCCSTPRALMDIFALRSCSGLHELVCARPMLKPRFDTPPFPCTLLVHTSYTPRTVRYTYTNPSLGVRGVYRKFLVVIFRQFTRQDVNTKTRTLLVHGSYSPVHVHQTTPWCTRRVPQNLGRRFSSINIH